MEIEYGFFMYTNRKNVRYYFETRRESMTGRKIITCTLTSFDFKSYINVYLFRGGIIPRQPPSIRGVIFTIFSSGGGLYLC